MTNVGAVGAQVDKLDGIRPIGLGDMAYFAVTATYDTSVKKCSYATKTVRAPRLTNLGTCEHVLV